MAWRQRSATFTMRAGSRSAKAIRAGKPLSSRTRISCTKMAGIYLHIPFCKQACHYCDFHFSTSLKYKDEMLAALHSELIFRKDYLQQQSIESIYLGGGTPSVRSIKEINEILDLIHSDVDVTASAEITIEANPDDLTKGKVNELGSSPINRFSIGIQSF